MEKSAKISLLILRLSLGWLYFYAGITKVLNPDWSAQGYLMSAKTFSSFYSFLAQPSILPVVNFLNEWGLTLLGLSLILGIFVRLSSVLGIVLMLLYYFPILQFPYPNSHSFIVDEHIIYALVLTFFACIRAGRFYGLDEYLSKHPLCQKYPQLAKFLG